MYFTNSVKGFISVLGSKLAGDFEKYIFVVLVVA